MAEEGSKKLSGNIHNKLIYTRVGDTVPATRQPDTAVNTLALHSFHASHIHSCFTFIRTLSEKLRFGSVPRLIGVLGGGNHFHF